MSNYRNNYRQTNQAIQSVDNTKSQEQPLTKTQIKTKIPWWIWLIMAIIILIAIVFIILWITKSSTTTPPNNCTNTTNSGIGQICSSTISCASGLTCDSATCKCKAPLPPTNLTMTSDVAGRVNIIFTPVNITPFSYNVILYNANDMTFAIKYTNISAPAIENITIIYNGLPTGLYTVHVIPISPICSSGNNMAEVTNVAVA